MANNNLKIAEEYSKRMKAQCRKVWVSDNLPMVPAGDRRAILKVYRKHFHTVEYDPITGICKCWVVAPDSTTILPEDTVGEFISIDTANTGAKANDPIKQSTRDILGIGPSNQRHIWIENSDSMPDTQH